jgi:hypothetical protein
MTVVFGDDVLERMVQAVEEVRDRMRRAAVALSKAGVPYAIIGGNAVGAWVAKVDKAAVRNTQDVDVLLRRADLEAAKQAMAAAGFIWRQAAGVSMFLDGPDTKARQAVHVIFTGEKVRPEYALPAPDVDLTMTEEGTRFLDLESLVRMKLTSYRRKDQVHLLDLLGVGLIDQSWVARFPPELGARLQHLIDTPDD